MGFFSRLTNLARGSWAAKRSSAPGSLTEAELQEELGKVKPAPSSAAPTTPLGKTERPPEETTATPSAERDSDGKIIKSL